MLHFICVWRIAVPWRNTLSVLCEIWSVSLSWLLSHHDGLACVFRYKWKRNMFSLPLQRQYHSQIDNLIEETVKEMITLLVAKVQKNASYIYLMHRAWAHWTQTQSSLKVNVNSCCRNGRLWRAKAKTTTQKYTEQKSGKRLQRDSKLPQWDMWQEKQYNVIWTFKITHNDYFFSKHHKQRQLVQWKQQLTATTTLITTRKKLKVIATTLQILHRERCRTILSMWRSHWYFSNE